MVGATLVTFDFLGDDTGRLPNPGRIVCAAGAGGVSNTSGGGDGGGEGSSVGSG